MTRRTVTIIRIIEIVIIAILWIAVVYKYTKPDKVKPVAVDALVGQHKVEIRKEGYAAASKSVAVAEGTTSEMAVTLTAKKTTAPYKVGDYYNENGKEGVVFEVSADGRHGKIVSLNESSESLLWSSDENEWRRLIGAADENDGSKNMAKVMQISAWRDKYPAFAWCASLGEGWYLPAKEELFSIYRVKNKLNNTLADKGEKIRDDFHWSSTEDDYQYSNGEFSACIVYMYDGYALEGNKIYNGYVRAVSAF